MSDRKRLNKLEQRIERLEAVIFSIATHKHRCKYIYIQDVLDAMEKHGLITERGVMQK